ncbi:MAG TPA: DUF1552 domain-containing protein [Bryobacteraceae bacterium]|nr:DUF1552 domain-containing protein [Bryobacteraceae bacterium]
MIVTGKHLSRRTLLRGIGTAIALPMLDCMTPAFAAPSRAAKSPMRLAFAYVPNGVMMNDWTPALEGAEFEFPRILRPLEPLREHVLVLSGLAQHNGDPLGDGPGDHARAASTFLTGSHPKKTAGADIHVGVSVDQVAAQHIGHATRFASLELGCDDGRITGNCDSGYSCAYSNSISWRTPSMPLPPEVNPRAVFERLFGAEPETPEARARRRRTEKSILDFVFDDASRLTGQLGPTDRRKMDEYLSAVREIERRIQMAEKDDRQIVPSIDKPDGVPAAYADYARLLFDLLLLAFQTDQTRIATYMLGREGSTRTYREIGIADAHHPLTHHRGNPEWIEKITRINTYHVEQLAYFLGKLNSTQDGDGTLLDHTLVVYGSGLSDGNRHLHDDLPLLVAGGGMGRGHIRYPHATPMNNLHLALLDRAGVKVESLGDSQSELDHLPASS